MSKFHRLIARVRTTIFGVKEFKAGHLEKKNNFSLIFCFTLSKVIYNFINDFMIRQNVSS